MVFLPQGKFFWGGNVWGRNHLVYNGEPMTDFRPDGVEVRSEILTRPLRLGRRTDSCPAFNSPAALFALAVSAAAFHSPAADSFLAPVFGAAVALPVLMAAFCPYPPERKNNENS